MDKLSERSRTPNVQCGNSCKSLAKAELSNHITVNLALNIFLIFQKLLSMLKLQDILNCGLLNFAWRAKTSEYIRHQRVCYVSVRNQNPCERLLEIWGSVQSSGTSLPFNGVALSLRCLRAPCPLSEDGNLFKTFRQNRSIRHLKILPSNQTTQTLSDSVSECPIKWFFKELLAQNSDFISVQLQNPLNDDKALMNLLRINENQETHWLDNVNTLEFLQNPNNLSLNVVDKLIAKTPKLKYFIGFLNSNQLQALILNKKWFVIQELVLVINNQHENLFNKLACCSLSLKILTIPQKWNWNCIQIQKYDFILNKILQSSGSTLEELNVDFSLLRLFMRKRIGPFKKVQLLRVKYCQSLDRDLGFRLLRSVNFNMLFPRLESLELHLSEEEPEEFYHEFHFIYQEFEYFVPDFVCATVTKLCLRSSWELGWNAGTLAALAEVFPNVKYFQVQHVKNLRPFLRKLWTSWPKLTSLDMFLLDQSVRQNLDGVFCGISDDDVDCLLCCSTSQLQEISPLRPTYASILDLPSLKQLKVQIHHGIYCLRRESRSSLSNSFITKITGYLAFAQMPCLQVEITRNECDWTFWEGFKSLECDLNFRSLQQFVKIVSSNPEYSWNQNFDFKYYDEPYMQF